MASDFFAGCLGGCAGIIVGHPFDTVKVRLQTQNFKNPLYRGTIHCFGMIIKKESALGLYKGMASPLYGLAAINAIVFGVQANIQRRLHNPNGLGAHFLAGSVAGLSQSVICGPMELAKTRMQIQGQGESRYKFTHTHHDYKGPVDCMKKIYFTEGVRGVFRGFTLTAARDTPSFAFYFLSYEYICRKLQRSPEELGTVSLLFAGGMAGICAWIVTYPIDVMKSKIQADMKNQYKNFLDCCKQSYKESGVSAFTRGLCSTLLRAFPVNAATFATVALTLRYVKSQKTDDGSYELSHYPLLHYHPSSEDHLHLVSDFPSSHT